MISYRKLAMRVLGHPLRVPTNTPRPASHRVTALALTAAMVAGMAAPAYAGTYYIGDGDITITKDAEGKTYVKHSGKSYENSLGDEDNTDIIIKGGTSANSPLQSASATLKVEDSENEDMVYPGDTKGSDSSDGGGEENETQSTEKDQTGDTTDGKNTGAGSSDPESKGSEAEPPAPTEPPALGAATPRATTPPALRATPPATRKTRPSPATPPAAGPCQRHGKHGEQQPAPESQFTYTGASLNVASSNDDEETRNESTTVLKRAAENFKNTAENVTNYVIRIINKARQR